MDENGYGRLVDLKNPEEPCRIPDGFKGWVSAVTLRHPDGSVAEHDTFPEPPKRKKAMPPEDKVETVPSVAVPSNLPDLKSVIPADGKVTGATLVMALIAVAGSGAVIKLVKDHLDRKADLREKELDKKQSDHAQCEMARAADAEKTRVALAVIEERVSTLEAWRVRAMKVIRDATKKPKD